MALIRLAAYGAQDAYLRGPARTAQSNYNVFRIMSGMGGLAYGDAPIRDPEAPTTNNNASQFQYVFNPEKNTDFKKGISKYEYKLGG